MDRRAFLARSAACVALAGGVAMPHIARAETRRLRLGHNNTPTSILQTCAQAFADAVAEKSGGALAIDIFPNAQLGSEAQMLKAVSDGTLDISLPPSGVMGEFSRLTSLIELPYLFRDAAHARQMLDGALGKHLAGELKAKSIIVLGWGEIGVRQITANKPIRTPADLRGLKIRVPLSDPILQTFKALGAQAETLSFAQLVEALKTGRFEAQENPINIIADSKLNAVQSHLSLTRHVYTPSLLTVSGDVFEELPQAQRDALVAAGPIAVAAMRARADKMETEALAQLRAAGMTIVEDIDRPAFQKAVADLDPQLSGVFGADNLKTLRGLVS